MSFSFIVQVTHSAVSWISPWTYDDNDISLMQYNLSLLRLQNTPKLLQQYVAVTCNKFGDFRIYSSMSPWQKKNYHLQGETSCYHTFF